ncbi:hypothetical protein Dimus_031415 [Dionaea muscipula]
MDTRKQTSFALAAFLLLWFAIFFTEIHSKPSPNPFGFIAKLQGAKKGQKINGLNKLKAYLARFGYLKYRSTYQNHNHTNGPTLRDPNLFDESLESAVKTYQRNFRLKSSGYLDNNTVKQMMKPRCGAPDIIRGRNTMLDHHDHDDKNSTLNYELLARYRGVFATGAHGDGEPFDGPGGVLGHSTLPPRGDSHYDADENWSSNPGPFEFDLLSVMIHEMGHVLGLGHSSVPEAIMFPSINPMEIKRRLARDDIVGIKTLYGLKI